MKYFGKFCYKFCNLFISEENGAIINVGFNKDKIPNCYEKRETPLLKNAAKQFEEYFNGKLKVFDLPIILKGTDFQIKVWKALQTIPYGETRSYGQLAAVTGNPRASRAVGMANNRNPIPIIVPCHRIIGHNGKLVGYAGGIELKEKLLYLESIS